MYIMVYLYIYIKKKPQKIKIGFNYMKNNQQAAIDQELEHQVLHQLK